MERNLAEVLDKALDLGAHCFNPDCSSACYRCLLDYGNQRLHPLLDPGLGTALLWYALTGETPHLDPDKARWAAQAVVQYSPAGWSVEDGAALAGTPFSLVFHNPAGQRFGLWVLHPLAARPAAEQVAQVMATTGIRPAIHNLFDLERRPFWVMNNLV